MPVNRVLLLVTARDRAQAGQMAEPLRVGAERALKALNVDGAESHVLMPIVGSQGPPSEHGRVVPDGLSNGVKLGGFDAAVEVTVPAGQALSALVGCLEEVRESAGHVLDLARSAAVAGTDVVILEGDAPIRLVYGMKRKPGTTHRDFCRYWETRYTSVTRFTPGLVGYYQLHADPHASRRAARAAGVGRHDLDGVALLWYRSLDDFAAATALVGPLVPHAGSPVPFKDRAVAEERRFSDLNQVTAIVAAEI
jgi:hypothetical protein